MGGSGRLLPFRGLRRGPGRRPGGAVTAGVGAPRRPFDGRRGGPDLRGDAAGARFAPDADRCRAAEHLHAGDPSRASGATWKTCGTSRASGGGSVGRVRRAASAPEQRLALGKGRPAPRRRRMAGPIRSRRTRSPGSGIRCSRALAAADQRARDPAHLRAGHRAILAIRGETGMLPTNPTCAPAFPI